MARPKVKKAIKRGKGPPLDSMNGRQGGIKPARHLLRHMQLHGSRSRLLTKLLVDEQPWSQALRQWREELIASLGGKKSLNVEAWELLSVLTIDKVVNDSIAAYLMTNPAVNRQKKRCFEIVMQRSKIAADYVTGLKMLREAIQSTRETNVTPLSERLKSLEAD